MSELNDPRVFFAAERTLLAWNRTSLTLMAFGFMIERFGLFLEMMAPKVQGGLEKEVSFYIGIAFVLLGAMMAIISIVQYRKVLSTLKPVEIPEKYWTRTAVFSNAVIAFLGLALIIYLFLSTR
jgi:putative membrane protein